MHMYRYIHVPEKSTSPSTQRLSDCKSVLRSRLLVPTDCPALLCCSPSRNRPSEPLPPPYAHVHARLDAESGISPPTDADCDSKNALPSHLLVPTDCPARLCLPPSAVRPRSCLFLHAPLPLRRHTRITHKTTPAALPHLLSTCWTMQMMVAIGQCAQAISKTRN